MSNFSSAADWKQWGLPLAVTALLVWVMSARFELPAAPMDEGTLLVYPEQILKGKLPYRDFETFYGPANPYLLAGVYAWTGPGIFAERAVGLAYRLLILAAILVLGRRWGSNAAAGCMLLAGVFLIPTNLVAYAWMGGMACTLWFIWAASPGGTGRRKFCAGLLAGGALLYRADLGPAVLLSGGVLAVWMAPRERKLLAAGLACGLLPLAVLALAAGPWQVYENLFHFPVLENERRLPADAVAGWMRWILGLHFTGSMLAVWAGWRLARADRRDVRGPLLAALGLCALGCSHQAMQRFDPTHLCFACFTSIGILPLALLAAVERRCGASSSRSRPLLAVATVLLAVTLASPAMVASLHQAVGFGLGAGVQPGRFLRWNARLFPLPLGELARTAACLDAVQRQAVAGERLFVGPQDLRWSEYNDTFLYHLLPQLTPATYFLEMNPGSANRPGSCLAADIASADWLILNRFWDEEVPNPAATIGSEAPRAIVRTQFTLVREALGFEVYRKTVRIARN